MKKERFMINHIPVVLWGEKSEKIYIAVHGNMSHKEDTVIEILAEEAVKKGYQVLSFDLPKHGDRKNEDMPCKVQYCVKELAEVMEYVRVKWQKISLFACSMGAYFSLLTYKNEPVDRALFLSPVVDMQRIIENMMTWFKVTPERLEKEKTIDTPIGETLYWDYYCYVKEHPVDLWTIPTDVLYGVKDNLCEFPYVKNFADKFNCGFKVLEEGEHYFHTPEQLKAFTLWIEEKIM